jgi:hypothetical protein
VRLVFTAHLGRAWRTPLPFHFGKPARQVFFEIKRAALPRFFVVFFCVLLLFFGLWQLTFESINEETGTFVGYCRYPSICKQARISCTGICEIEEEDGSGMVGSLQFTEGAFIVGHESHELLLEESSVGLLKLYRVQEADAYILSMGGYVSGSRGRTNSMKEPVVNGVSTVWSTV